ncbi:Gfo/Idh/MocA family oxidoreductase, partial [Candidatus Bathyarchaeota archaeon]|nr:Gfo/Idh/MocA family oxidoreductase [Candidatus Bathyarchaeota archaeon]
VVGSGWVAVNRHIPVLVKDRRVKIIGIVGKATDEIRKAVKKFGIPKIYDSVEKLLDNSLDIIDICTPPFTHCEIAVKAAESGCHILVEKPFAMNTKEAERMMEAAQRNNVKICVSHNFLFSHSMKKARRLRDVGAFGKVTSVIALQMSNLKRRLPKWYPLLPGGLFFDESPHIIYSILEFLGGNASVSWSRVERWENNPQPLSRVEAFLEAKAENSTAYIYSAFNSPRDEWIMAIMGTKRVAIIDFFRDTIIELKEGGRHTPFEVLMNSLNFLWQMTKETANSSFRFLAKSLYFGHDELIRKFIDAVEKNTEPPVPAKDGKLILKIIEQILKKGGYSPD